MTIGLTPAQVMPIKEQLVNGRHPDEHGVVQDALELLRRNSDTIAKI